ncbi:MAG: efflux RND transporter periplasmic adaptor subunit [Myxococcota bacterium]
MRPGTWIAGAGGAGLLLAWGLVGLLPDPGRAADAPEERTLLPVAVRTIERVDAYSVREIHAGRVVARRESALGFERGGRLDAVLVERGDRVVAGDVLARLDVRELTARKRELEARVRQMDARLELARSTERRRKALRQSNHASIEELDQATSEASAIAAELEAARASLEQVGVAIEQSSLLAPYGGQITERHEDEGTVAAAGQAILEIVESGALEVHVGVPPESAEALEIGSVHEVEVGGRPYPARIAALIQKLETRTRTVPVVFALEGAPEHVRAGDLARIALERRVQSVGMWLPITALAESRRGLWSAYVVVPRDGGQVVERREVEVLHAESDRAFVRGTLRDGDQVVATGLHRLVPGQRVSVLEDSGPGALRTAHPSRSSAQTPTLR